MPSAGVARDVVGVHALRVLDAVAQPERPPDVLGRLEAVERLAVGEVADRVDRHRHPRRSAAARTAAGEPVGPHQPHPAAAEQQRGARAERAVHEHLHVAAARGDRRSGRTATRAASARRRRGARRTPRARRARRPCRARRSRPRRARRGAPPAPRRASPAARRPRRRRRSPTPPARAAGSPIPRASARALAIRSAAEFTHSVCPSCARSAVGTSPVTASSAASVGRSPSGQSSSRQPRPRSQPSPGFAAASIRSSASPTERVPNSRSSRQPERPAREVHVRVDEARHHRPRRRGRRSRPARPRGPMAAPVTATGPRRPDPRVDEHDGTVSGHAALHASA